MAFRSLRLLRTQTSGQCLVSESQGFVSGSKDVPAATRKSRHYSSENPAFTDSSIVSENLAPTPTVETEMIINTGPRLLTTTDEAKRFMKDCLRAVGTPPDHAETVANNLIEADYRGFFSHGMNRLEMYIRDIQHGTTDVNVDPVIIKETVATALVDGKNGLGAVIGKGCMEIAISKAKNVGIGFVVARGSNHYGIAGMYGSQAIHEGLLGLSFSNTSPFMTPTRAKKCALGTNPLTLGAPGPNGDNFLLDMATTAVAVGKIEFAKRKNEPIPEGWALNNEGLQETNPTIAYNCAKLMPLGGNEEHSGYKGYGLGMLVEIFCGILSGSSYGPHIRPWGRSNEIANLGQSFIAIDPNAFEPGFPERLGDLMTYLRKVEPVNPEKSVLVHGDKERDHKAQVDQDGGLEYVENQHKTNKQLAEELKVKPMVSKQAVRL